MREPIEHGWEPCPHCGWMLPMRAYWNSSKGCYNPPQRWCGQCLRVVSMTKAQAKGERSRRRRPIEYGDPRPCTGCGEPLQYLRYFDRGKGRRGSPRAWCRRCGRMDQRRLADFGGARR